jgi:putative ABC transport system ATP-binding protein
MSKARELRETLGINGKSRLKPTELSGGEKQRVAITRALLNDPPCFLADERTASLDSTTGQSICEILLGIAERRKSTVAVVSHDPRWSRFAHRTIPLADSRVIQMDAGGW